MSTLTLERLKEILAYDPATGIFRWKVRSSNRIKVGDRAGAVVGNGRRFILIDGEKFQAHRLAWFYVHGEWPDGDLKQRNGDYDDCSIGNLFTMSKIEQARLRSTLSTNTSGFRGVSRHKEGRWQSTVTANYQQIKLGTFATPEESSAAYEHAMGLLSSAKTPEECEVAADLIIQHRRKRVAWERLSRDGRRTVWTDFETFAADVGAMASDESTIAALDEARPIGPDNFRWLDRPVGKFDRSTKEGRAAYARAYRGANPDRYRHNHIRSNYDIDEVEYQRMKAAQGGRCLICEKIPDERLAIDHNHDTKAVRALLCKQCNFALGQFKDNLTLLRGAVRYLEQYEPEEDYQDPPIFAALAFGT